MSTVLVSAQGIGKHYPLVSRRDARMRALGRLLFTRRAPDGVDVLKPLDLEIRRGESFGIVGENGAGKSTLLKLVTGVLTPSVGSIQVNGSIGALLELGAGFHPEFSGRDNLRMAAALAGLDARAVGDWLPQIIEFADIGQYIDEPIKHYSSGMVVRLGFAVVAALKPDLLITDEVLAVGDESFQKKCIAWIEEYLAGGGTLMLVSHGMYHVQKLCRQALWLRQGEVAARGDVFEVTQAYLAYHERRQRQQDDSTAAQSDSPYRIVHYSIDGAEDCQHIVLDERRHIDIDVEMEARDNKAPVLLFGIAHGNGLPIYGVSSDMDQVRPLALSAHRYRFRFELDLGALLPGEYLLKLHPMDSQGLRLFATHEVAVVIRGETREMGAVRLPHQWRE
ncbi:ABC transporter ATP-binding protein [Pseudofulvimonas gallinarii]|uniref:Lipopolysaccharide transport system ATP-binding protein n=1 Tax=Pseudofulvimonas gallinarii TaxID=634155 RepID=A0A4R3LPC3_9GAMM|nr:ABC transporter ATP-binding protein [Pseudofulvimonas gallinarii]TCT00385.1 lipopolysaccharide transport system ATP-binding protein [Pseudofulvimonas gallinarii]